MAIGNVKQSLSGRISVTIYLHAPTRRKYDLDNRVKAIQDVLTTSGVYLDDEQIDQLLVYRCEIIKGGRAVVVIKEID